MAVFIFRTISLFALALAFLASARAQQTCQLMLKETATTATEIELLENFLRVFRCDGVSNFKLSLTWSPRLTTVNCGIVSTLEQSFEELCRPANALPLASTAKG